MAQQSVKSSSKVLHLLPDLEWEQNQQCSLHVPTQLDLMLLAIEALDLGAAEKMLVTIQELELTDVIKNRVNFWRLRCSNPWRRSYTRSRINMQQAKALTIITSYRAKQLSLPIRQLLVAQQEMHTRNLPVGVNFFLSEYFERFESYFTTRMNPRRAKVAFYLASETELQNLALDLLNKLLFCSGTSGLQRFWVSLFDGEVA
ncbi:MAG: DUF3038 domain-containing protein [Cyanobacteria bacterium J083]|nr:MAG: DUF3038 domain-containing protein [Cyanobacteria bacterium J083]